MKFHTHKYWKHDGCVDTFFHPVSIRFDEDGKNAILSGFWCIQGVDLWWSAPRLGDDRLVIGPENYDRWNPYTPKGRPDL